LSQVVCSQQPFISACLTCSIYNKFRQHFMCDLRQCYHFTEEEELYKQGEWITGTVGVQLGIFNEIRKAGLAFHGISIEEPTLPPKIEAGATPIDEALELEKKLAEASRGEEKTLGQLVHEIREEVKQMGQAVRDLVKVVKDILRIRTMKK